MSKIILNSREQEPLMLNYVTKLLEQATDDEKIEYVFIPHIMMKFALRHTDEALKELAAVGLDETKKISRTIKALVRDYEPLSREQFGIQVDKVIDDVVDKLCKAYANDYQITLFSYWNELLKEHGVVERHRARFCCECYVILSILNWIKGYDAKIQNRLQELMGRFLSWAYVSDTSRYVHRLAGNLADVFPFFDLPLNVESSTIMLATKVLDNKLKGIRLDPLSKIEGEIKWKDFKDSRTVGSREAVDL